MCIQAVVTALTLVYLRESISEEMVRARCHKQVEAKSRRPTRNNAHCGGHSIQHSQEVAALWALKLLRCVLGKRGGFQIYSTYE